MSRTRMLVLGIMLVLGVGVLALNVLPVIPVPGTHAMLAYDLPRVSANTQVSHPGLFLFDGREDSAWSADCDGRDIWVELDLGGPKDIEGLRLFKTDASAVTVLFETDGWWIPTPCPDLAGLIGWQDIDLSPLEIASSRIRLVLRPKPGAAFAGLGEVEVLGRAHQVDPRRLAPVTLRQSGNPGELGAANLFDGNTNSVWNTTSASGLVWAEADLRADTAIMSVRLFVTETPVSQCSLMLHQAGQWIGTPELSSINGLKAGWNEVRLARSFRADAVRLESRAAGNPGGWLGEAEIWGYPAETAQVNAWMPATAEEFRGAFRADGLPASYEMLTWVSKSARLSFNGGEPVALAPGLSRVVPEHSQLLTGRNGFEIAGSAHAGVLLKEKAADGRLMVGAPDQAAVTDGSTTTSAVFGMGRKDLVLVLNRPAYMEHLRVLLSEPGQQDIAVSLWDGQSWVSPEEGSRTSLAVAEPGWYTVPVKGRTDRLRLTSMYAVSVAEIQCFGSPISEAAPSVTILEPAPGDSVGDTVTVTGKVDSPNVTVTVNGHPVTLTGDRFSANVRLESGSDGKLTATATDGSGRTGSTEVSVCPSPVLTLSQLADGFMTASGTISVSGTVGDQVLNVKINGSYVPLRARDFSQSVPLTPGFNKIRIDAQLRSGAVVGLTRVVCCDTEAPVVRLLTPLDGEVTAGSTARIIGAVEDLLPTGVLVNGLEAEVQGNLFMAEVPVAEGENRIRIEAKDALGRVTVLEIPVEYDAQAPEVTIDAPQGGTLEKDTVDIVGRVAEANLTLLTVYGQVVEPDKNGKFTCRNIQLKEGPNRIEVQAKDAAGHTTTQSVEVTLDTLPPEPFAPTLNPDGWTNRDQVKVAFVAADAGTGVVRYEMKVDAEEFAPAVSPVMVSNLGEGHHKVVVRAYDKLGQFTEGEAEIKIDRTVPEAFVPTVSPSQWTSRPVTVSFGAKDALSGLACYELTIDGGSAVAVTSPYTLPTLSDGEHTVHITAIDHAGNKAESSTKVYTDATPPEGFDLTVCPAGWSSSRKLTVSFSTTDATSGIDKYQVRVNGGKWANTVSPADVVAPADGKHVIEVKALDRAGSETIARAEASVDTAPPAEFTAMITPEGWTNNPEPVVTFGTTDEGSGIDHYEIAIDGGKPVVAESPFTCPKLTDGEHTIEVRAIDGIGSVRISRVTASIDTTPPAAPTGFDVIPGHEKTKASWDRGTEEIAEFRLRRVTGAGTRIITVSATARKYYDFDVANGFIYGYQIQAVDRAGNLGVLSSLVWVVPGQACMRPTPEATQSSVSAFSTTTSGGSLTMVGIAVSFPSTVITTSPDGTGPDGQIYGAKVVDSSELPQATDGSVAVGEAFAIGVYIDADQLRQCSLPESADLRFDYSYRIIPSGFTEHDLYLYRYDPSLDAWERVPGATRNTVTHEVENADDELIVYAVRASHYEEPSTAEFQKLKASPYAALFEANDESVSPDSGTMSVTVTDVNLPGIAELDTVIRRRYSSALAYAQFRDMRLNGGSSEVRTQLNSWRSLGLGWELDIPWVEMNGERRATIHLPGGGSYPLGTLKKESAQYRTTWWGYDYLTRGQYISLGNGEEEALRTTYELTDPTRRLSEKKLTVETRSGLIYHFQGKGTLRALWVQDAHGNTISYDYDLQGRLMEVTDTVGRTVSLAYGSNGRVQSISWPGTSGTVQVIYQYDEDRDLTSVKDPAGRVTTYDYYRQTDSQTVGSPLINDSTNVTTQTVEWRENDMGVPQQFTTTTNFIRQPITTTVKLIRKVVYPSGGSTTYGYSCDTYPSDLTDTFVYPSQVYGETNTVRYTTSYHRTWVSVKSRAQIRRGEITQFAETNYAPQRTTAGDDNEGEREYISKMIITSGSRTQEMSFALVGFYAKDGDGQVTDDQRVTRLVESVTKQNDAMLSHQKYVYTDGIKPTREIISMLAPGDEAAKPVIIREYDKFGNKIHQYNSATNLDERWVYSNSQADEIAEYNNFVGSATLKYLEPLDRDGVLAYPLAHLTRNVLPDGTAQASQVQYVYDSEWNQLKEWRWNGSGWNEVEWAFYQNGQVRFQVLPTKLTQERVLAANPVIDQNWDVAFEYDNGNLGANLTKITTKVSANDSSSRIEVVREFDYYPNGLLMWEKDPRSTATHVILTSYEYDRVGRLTKVTYPDNSCRINSHDDSRDAFQVTDEKGTVTFLQYDGHGHLLSVVRDLNGIKAETRFGYNSDWKINSVTEPHDLGEDDIRYTNSYEYDALGRVTKVTFPHKEGSLQVDIPVVTLQYDSATNTTIITDESGNVTKERKDWGGRLVQAVVQERLGGAYEWLFEYDSLGHCITETNPKGGQIISRYDCLGNLAGQVARGASPLNPNVESPLGNARDIVTSYGYDARGNRAWEIRPNANALGLSESGRVLYSYDELDHLIRAVEPVDEVRQRTTKFYYDRAGNKVRQIDPNGLETNSEYDGRGRLVSETNAAGHVKRYSYDATGNRLSSTDQNGFTTRFEYDALGRLTRTILPDCTADLPNDNPYLEVQYTKNGQKSRERDLNGVWIEYEYLPRNLVETVNNLSSGVELARYTYYLNGLVSSETDAEGLVTQYEYDSAGHVTLKRQIKKEHMGQSPKYELAVRAQYDGLGQKTKEWDEFNPVRSTRFENDNLGRLIKVTDPLGNVTTNEYDPEGNLRRVTDARGNKTVRRYNLLNWLTEEIDSRGKPIMYYYDLGGRRTSETDRKLQDTTYSYYPDNTLKEVQYADGGRVLYEYDSSGNPTHVKQEGAGPVVETWYNCDPVTKEYAPDPRNRVNMIVRTIGYETFVTKYRYDAAGNITEMQYPGSAKWVTYNYDSMNRVTSVGKTGTDQAFAEQISYDRVGVMTQLTMPNDLALTITPDELHRPAAMDYRKAAGTQPVLSLDYQYKNHQMNMASISKSDATGLAEWAAFEYDNLDQLTSESKSSITGVTRVYPCSVSPNAVPGGSISIGFSWWASPTSEPCKVETAFIDTVSWVVLWRFVHDPVNYGGCGTAWWTGPVSYTVTTAVPEGLQFGGTVAVAVSLIGPDGSRKLLTHDHLDTVPEVGPRCYQVGTFCVENPNDTYHTNLLSDDFRDASRIDPGSTCAYDSSGHRVTAAHYGAVEVTQTVFQDQGSVTCQSVEWAPIRSFVVESDPRDLEYTIVSNVRGAGYYVVEFDGRPIGAPHFSGSTLARSYVDTYSFEAGALAVGPHTITVKVKACSDSITSDAISVGVTKRLHVTSLPTQTEEEFCEQQMCCLAVNEKAVSQSLSWAIYHSFQHDGLMKQVRIECRNGTTVPGSLRISLNGTAIFSGSATPGFTAVLYADLGGIAKGATVSVNASFVSSQNSPPEPPYDPSLSDPQPYQDTVASNVMRLFLTRRLVETYSAQFLSLRRETERVISSLDLPSDTEQIQWEPVISGKTCQLKAKLTQRSNERVAVLNGYESGLSLVDIEPELPHQGFCYDAAGNRSARTDPNVQAVNETYVIDPTSNRVTAVKNGEFQTETFSYDDNGNMTGRIADGDTWIYTYDARDRMVSVQKNGEIVAQYLYDPEGNRVKATYPAEGVSTIFVYDLTQMMSENPILEEDSSGGRRNYIYLNRRLLARVDGTIDTGEKYWYVVDHLGSTRGLTDAQGTLIWWADYEAFGKIKASGGTRLDEVPRFTGKSWDEHIGLYYYGARYYDPGLGRWTSIDPSRDGLNWYTYCGSNPLIRIDPTGRVSVNLSFVKGGYQLISGMYNITAGVIVLVSPEPVTKVAAVWAVSRIVYGGIKVINGVTTMVFNIVPDDGSSESSTGGSGYGGAGASGGWGKDYEEAQAIRLQLFESGCKDIWAAVDAGKMSEEEAWQAIEALGTFLDDVFKGDCSRLHDLVSAAIQEKLHSGSYDPDQQANMPHNTGQPVAV